MTLDELLNPAPLSNDMAGDIEAALDAKAKPPKSLGRVEEIAIRIGLIQKTIQPRIVRPELVVFAGDHGLTQSGVAAFPSSVTVSMVDTLLAGKASANAIAKVVGAKVHVVDAGVDADLSERPDLIQRKISWGTKHASQEPAMTRDEAHQALLAGASVISERISKGADLIALGEMGIGNSSSAALLIHRLTGAPLEACIGRGSGHTDEGLNNKRLILAKAAARSDATDPMDVLVQFGGFEIAQMAGAVLECARRRVPVLIDGFICSSAALLAIRLAPAAKDFCIFTHASAEPGYAVLAKALDINPLLHLDMRLGEGTGALLAIPIIKAACAITTDVASLVEVMGDA